MIEDIKCPKEVQKFCELCGYIAGGCFCTSCYTEKDIQFMCIHCPTEVKKKYPELFVKFEVSSTL